jgi:hypothetical protein
VGRGVGLHNDQSGGVAHVLRHLPSGTLFGRHNPAIFALPAFGGALFGLPVSLVQARWVAKSQRARGFWIENCVLIASGSCALVHLLYGPLGDLQMAAMRFQIEGRIALSLAMAMTLAPTVLLAGWIAFSAAAGLLLWAMRLQQDRSQTKSLPQIFD